MQYKPHFDFETKIQEHPKNSTVILDLFNASSGDEIQNQAKRDSRYYLATSIHHLHASKYIPVVEYIYTASVICYKVPSGLNNHVLQHIHCISRTEQSKQLLFCWICTPLSRRAARENKRLPCLGIEPETTRQHDVYSCSQFLL